MKKILLVEDDNSLTEILTALLNRQFENLAVMTAENGKQAAEILDSTQVDLILTDLQMPVMNGFELAELCQRRFPRLPLLGMTGNMNPEVEVKLGALGINQIFVKPFEFRNLLDLIAHVLNLEARAAVEA